MTLSWCTRFHVQGPWGSRSCYIPRQCHGSSTAPQGYVIRQALVSTLNKVIAIGNVGHGVTRKEVDHAIGTSKVDGVVAFVRQPWHQPVRPCNKCMRHLPYKCFTIVQTQIMLDPSVRLPNMARIASLGEVNRVVYSNFRIGRRFVEVEALSHCGVKLESGPVLSVSSH